MKDKTYIAIDLKSFYASVECRERGLDPLDTNLVVADESRTDKTICLAVTPSLIDGLNMDAVYESLVRQIAGDKLQTDSGESLKESVARDEKKKQLEKQIATLENKMRREKQLNRRMEMNAELKRLRRSLEVL